MAKAYWEREEWGKGKLSEGGQNVMEFRLEKGRVEMEKGRWS